ncbi:MAG TPA: lytic transglycosylase F [Steroidobacteraceae bacterium]|nr:lytic transglycosylase F [Steroidobacteraceae bacterium]
MLRPFLRARLTNYRRRCCAALATGLAMALAACGSGEQAKPAPAEGAPAPAPAPTTITEAEALLVGKPWLGDLDGMTARRVVRMLVIYNKTNYFLDKAQQRGLTYDMGLELEKWLNRGNKDRTRPIRVVFIPTSRDRLLTDLAQGRGDIAAAGLAITPERQQLVSFTVPFADDVSEMLITSAEAPVPDTVDALSGRSVYVRRSSSYYTSLEALNARLEAAGKPPVIIELADENLEDEDILEMVNAGLIDTTVVDSYLARFWEQVFPNLRLHPELVLRSNSQIAWAVRKDAPMLKATLDQFVAKNQAGTAMGNMILRKYLQTTKWARNATSAADMKRFEDLSKYFKKYATQYEFEWLLLVAQGYQESGLDQSIRSPVGAVGVMQVMPTTANDRNVKIPDIHLVEPNIHAGAKYMRFLVNQYFDEPGIDVINRHLFAFAAYNGGPNRIARLRREAAAQGLDANKWFNNVELLAAKQIGRETVQYVSNIYKYYVAYKLIVDRAEQRNAARDRAVKASPQEKTQ